MKIRIISVLLLLVITNANANEKELRIAECQLSHKMITNASRHVIPKSNQTNVDLQHAAPGLTKAKKVEYINQVVENDKTKRRDTVKMSIQSVGVAPETVSKTHNYFEIKPKPARSERIYVDRKTGMINFQVREGYLKDNIIALLNETREANVEKLKWEIAPHEEETTYWITGNSMLEIAQALVGHHKKPEQVKIGLFTNGIVAVYYQSNREYVQ